jgi:bis(5'-nucleosyl)-tetraphosphatase (symmetrical)
VATYVIGDIQGCFRTLSKLLARVSFHRGRDRLWLLGDLVNRGPRSLDVLRFCADLGDAVQGVLGNHDLHLLGLWRGVRKKRRKDTLDAILDASDGAALCAWLGRWPLMRVEGDWVLAHAALLPAWSLADAMALARDAERMLGGPDMSAVLAAYGDDHRDTWRAGLGEDARVQTVLNALTRLRVCDARGRMDLSFKSSPAEAPPGFAPWFSWPAAERGQSTILVGHWAALGFHRQPGVIALDGGCVWGQELLAMCLEDQRIEAEACDDL